MSRNKDVADLLYRISKLLEVQGVAFKPRAYQRAAQNIESLSEDVEILSSEGRLDGVPGVGEAIAKKVKEYLETGKLQYYEKLTAEVPEGLAVLMTIPGLGPKKALRLYRELKIASLDDLKKAIAEHKVRDLAGFGERSEADLERALGQARASAARISWFQAERIWRDLESALRTATGAKRIEVAGSFRRGRDTVGDLDILVEATESQAAKVIEAFAALGPVRDVLERGTTRSRVHLRTGLQVDLRVLPKESFGAALLYFTGSKEHNIALRSLALKQKLTLNEYGLAKEKGGQRIEGATEEGVYRRLGLAWIPPELRENRGEVEQAAAGNLPELVKRTDLRGDLHTHTTESDGSDPLTTMLARAQKMGHEYYGVSDHSPYLAITRGLDARRLAKQRQAIDAAQKDFPKLTILQGCEVDIHKDGTLDLPAQALESLDYVIGSVHSSFQLDSKTQTARVVAAMDAGIDILAHPTGRRFGQRPSIDLDLERVAAHAAETGVLLEVDATPDRIDLWGEPIALGRENGAAFVIDSDAHSADALDLLHVGVVQARRGGLGKEHVANAWPLAKLRKRLGRAKRR